GWDRRRGRGDCSRASDRARRILWRAVPQIRGGAVPAPVLHSEVARVLGEEIGGGVLPAGHVLSLAGIEQRLSLSRTVVREAVREAGRAAAGARGAGGGRSLRGGRGAGALARERVAGSRRGAACCARRAGLGRGAAGCVPRALSAGSQPIRRSDVAPGLIPRN